MSDDILPGFTRVSAISGAFGGYGNIPKEILNNAAARGSQVHDIIRDVILNVPVDGERYIYRGERNTNSLVGYMESFWKFWRPHDDSPAVFPDRMNDFNLMLTGEVDLITTINDERVLIDWKCTACASPAWDIQGNGYSLLYENSFHQVIDKILFVRLDKDGAEPEVVEIKHDIDLFMTAYEFYHRFFKGQKCNLECE